MSEATLLPPNATPAERAVEAAAGARMAAIPTPQASLWDPATCPAAILPWLAWAFSVDHWRSSWPEATKRAVIAAAPEVHRLKGTRGAVRRALQAMNARVDLREWFETGGQPYTATATLFARGPNGAPQLSQELVEDLAAAFAGAAPARAHIELIFGVMFPNPMSVAAALVKPAEIIQRRFVRPAERLGAAIAAALLAPAEVLVLTGRTEEEPLYVGTGGPDGEVAA